MNYLKVRTAHCDVENKDGAYVTAIEKGYPVAEWFTFTPYLGPPEQEREEYIDQVVAMFRAVPSVSIEQPDGSVQEHYPHGAYDNWPIDYDACGVGRHPFLPT